MLYIRCAGETWILQIFNFPVWLEDEYTKCTNKSQYVFFKSNIQNRLYEAVKRMDSWIRSDWILYNGENFSDEQR